MNRNILITAGGTREAIDGVRYITNFSTGKTGGYLATYFAERGYQIDLCIAKDAFAPLHPNIRIYYFTDADSLQAEMKNLLDSTAYLCILHAAAVSDYKVSSIEVDGAQMASHSIKKIDSNASEITLKLARTPKIISTLRKFSKNASTKIVAFKLTNNASESEKANAVSKLFKNSIDYVVQNDLSEIAADKHKTTIWDNRKVTARCETKQELATKLEALITDSLKEPK